MVARAELAPVPPAAPVESESPPEAAFARAVAAVASSIAPLPAPPAPVMILPPSPVGYVRGGRDRASGDRHVPAAARGAVADHERDAASGAGAGGASRELQRAGQLPGRRAGADGQYGAGGARVRAQHARPARGAALAGRSRSRASGCRPSRPPPTCCRRPASVPAAALARGAQLAPRRGGPPAPRRRCRSRRRRWRPRPRSRTRARRRPSRRRCSRPRRP